MDELELDGTDKGIVVNNTRILCVKGFLFIRTPEKDEDDGAAEYRQIKSKNCQVFDVYEDGSKKKIDSNEGWLWDREYSSMKLAKIGLAHVKEMLDDGWSDVTFAVDNAVTLECLRTFFHGDECSAPIQRTEHIVYHIEKRGYEHE